MTSALIKLLASAMVQQNTRRIIKKPSFDPIFVLLEKHTTEKKLIFLTQIIVICNQYEIKEIIKKIYMYIQLGAILVMKI